MKVVDEVDVDVVDEEDVDEELVEVVDEEVIDEVGVDVEDEEGIDDEAIELVEVVEEEDVVVVDEDAFGVTAKYATAPARMIITITMTTVIIREIALNLLPLMLLTYKVLTEPVALLFVYCYRVDFSTDP